MAFKRTFTDPVPQKNEHRYADIGIDTFHGQARFTGHNTIEVTDEILEAKHILIAAGAEPVRLGIPGEEYLATNEDFLVLDRVPKRIVLVGGGYIAAEFSHIAARAGAKVTVLQRSARILPQFDADLVGVQSFRVPVHDASTRQPQNPAGQLCARPAALRYTDARLRFKRACCRASDSLLSRFNSLLCVPKTLSEFIE